MSKPLDTSWGKVADWYDDLLQNEDTYQRQVILPNILRLLALKPGVKLLDLACGSGFFAREFAAAGAAVTGVDISPELLALAKRSSPGNITYQAAPADDLSVFAPASFDLLTLILAIQNIAPVKAVLAEVARVLKPEGRFLLVMNHPNFRIPKQSSWAYDESAKVQYRRIDAYLSEQREPISMHPGAAPEAKTYSFHRPLQYYFKLLANAGLAVSRLEEWISHKKSQPGPRAAAEDKARQEFPLFLTLEVIKI